jgi:hypothetical protein
MSQNDKKARAILDAESPHEFLRRADQSAVRRKQTEIEDLLKYMPIEFVEAYRAGTDYHWKNKYPQDNDWWPVYNDDDDTWFEVIYFWEYTTNKGKIWGEVNELTKDGDTGLIEDAEIGTPAYDRLLQQFNAEELKKAIRRYLEWVAERGQDPLKYIRAGNEQIDAKFIASFVREGDRLKLQFLQAENEPTALNWEEIQARAQIYETWRKALVFCRVNAHGVTNATAREIQDNTGGAWNDRGQLIVPLSYSWMQTTPLSPEQIQHAAREELAQFL